MNEESTAEVVRERNRDRSAGFSIVELIVVVLILGILTAVAVPIIQGIQERAERSTIQAALHDMATYHISKRSLGFRDAPESGQIRAFPEGVTGILFTERDPLRVCVVAAGPNAPRPYLKSGPGCNTYDWVLPE